MRWNIDTFVDVSVFRKGVCNQRDRVVNCLCKVRYMSNQTTD
jgi:hypothetical protein